jgi:hypothetical protein
MMKNFMVSESVTWGMKLDEVLDESNTMPFPREAAVMMVYGRGGGGHVSNPSPGTLAH